MVGNRFVGKEDVAIVYEQELLGPRGQMVLDHYENRPRLVLSGNGYPTYGANGPPQNKLISTRQNKLKFAHHFTGRLGQHGKSEREVGRLIGGSGSSAKGGRSAIRSADLGRTHRERLLQAGFLQEVIKGWCVPASPGAAVGDGTAWLASFWSFCATYLEARFGSDWSLSPEHSLLLQVGDWAVPRQLLMRSPKARNKITALPHDVSIVETRAALPADGQAEELAGLRTFALPAALVAVTPSFFRQQANAARAALAGIPDASEVLVLLLGGGRSTVAGRLAGGLRHIGRRGVADEIVAAMRGRRLRRARKGPVCGTVAVRGRRTRSPLGGADAFGVAWDARGGCRAVPVFAGVAE